MAIKIPFLAEVREFLAGTRDLEDSLEDVVDALDDVTRAGAKVDAQVGEDLESVGREADASAEKVETSFREAFRAVEQQGRTSSRKVRADVEDVGHKGSQTLREFSDEAKQNVAESVSSFTGSAESGIDAIQSTFGGLVSALGPAGVIGAAAAAAGVGLARGMFEKAQQRVQELSESVADLAGDLLELGAAAPGADQVADALDRMATSATTFGRSLVDWGGKPSTELLDLKRQAEQARVSFTDLALGMAGDSTALDRALTSVTRQLAEFDRFGTDQAGQAARARYADQITALEKLKSSLEGQKTVLETTQLVLQARAAAMKDDAEATTAAADAGVAYADATHDTAVGATAAAAAIERKNDAIAEEISQNVAAENAVIGYAQALDDTTAAIKENGDTHDVNTAKGRANRRALLELAGSLVTLASARAEDSGKVADYNKVIQQNRRDFIKAAEAAGYTKTQAEKLATQYGLVPKVVKTKVTDDGTAKQTQEKIDNIKSSGVPVPVTPDMSDFDRKVRSHLDGTTYYLQVAPRTGKNVPA